MHLFGGRGGRWTGEGGGEREGGEGGKGQCVVSLV